MSLAATIELDLARSFDGTVSRSLKSFHEVGPAAS